MQNLLFGPTWKTFFSVQTWLVKYLWYYYHIAWKIRPQYSFTLGTKIIWPNVIFIATIFKQLSYTISNGFLFFVFGFVLAIVFTSKISLNYFYSAAMCFHAWYNDYLQYFIIFSELFISINLPTTVEDIFPFWSKRTVAAKIMNNYHIKMIFSFIKENKKMKSIFLMANRFGCICV